MSLRDLLSVFKGKKPSAEELVQEALLADELMQKANQSEDNAQVADYLKQYTSLVKDSKQADIYELGDVQEIIAKNVVKAAFATCYKKDVIETNGMNILEKAITDIISSLNEVYRDTMNQKQCTKLARKNAKNIQKTLLAADLMQKANQSEDNAQVADYLKQYTSLVKDSKQADIYELDKVQEIIAKKVVRTLFTKYQSKDLIKTNGVSLLDKAIEDIIFSLSEVYNGTMNQERCAQLAKEKAKENIAINLREIAKTIHDATQKDQYFDDDLIQRYGLFRQVYSSNFGEEELPSANLKSSPQDSTGVKTSLDWIVYSGGVKQNLRGLNSFVSNLNSKLIPLKYHLDTNANTKRKVEGLIQQQIKNVQYCVRRAEHNPRELENLKNTIKIILSGFQQKVKNAEEYILRRQEYFEDRISSFYEQGDLQSASKELDKMAKFTTAYETVLEESGNAVRERLFESKPLLRCYGDYMQKVNENKLIPFFAPKCLIEEN